MVLSARSAGAVCSSTDLGAGNDSAGQSACLVVQRNATAIMVACEHEGGYYPGCRTWPTQDRSGRKLVKSSTCRAV